MGERLANRVMLIGWDAADWQIIMPLLEKGGMPNLKRFLDEGVWGNISTLNPVLSPILWNSIATGKHADKHDIMGFMEPDGQGYVRPVSSTSRKAKAIWNICSQNGLKSNVVGWFASYPAEQIHGAVVTDRYEAFSSDPDKFANDPNSYHPVSLKDDLRTLHITPGMVGVEDIRAFIPEVESIDTNHDEHPGVFAALLAQCASVHNAATYLVEGNDWDFSALYYTAIDHFGHAFQEYHPPKMDHVTDEQYRLYHQVITSVYQYHDMMLGRLFELGGDDTTFVLLSDHGFKNGLDRPKIFVNPENPNERTGPGMGPVAWHRQFGVFAAKGPGVAKGREIREIGLLDVCPTILTLLGIPVGEDMDGRVIEQVFEHPPQVDTVPTHEGEHPDDGVFRGEHVEDPYAAQEVLKQLAELGYVDAPGEDKELAVKRTIRDREDALATVYFSSGRSGKAVEVLERLVAEYDEPYFKYRLGNVLAKLGRFDEVETLIANNIDDPEHAPMMNMLKGQTLLGQGKTEEAMEVLEQVRRTMPGMPRIRTLLARPMIKHEMWDDAERVLREALEINEDDPEALDLLGVVLRHKGQHEHAVNAHMKSVTLLHEQPVAHLNLGIALMQAEQWDWAIRACEVSLSLFPNNPVAHRHLAWIYENIKKDKGKAREHASMSKQFREDSDDYKLKEELGLDRW
ncbi:MAG: alkaline phosphatase family protein [Phycisphaerales bacterium]|nr:alkaline phosphatase family protein [Phycisphaerales bacterium]